MAKTRYVNNDAILQPGILPQELNKLGEGLKNVPQNIKPAVLKKIIDTTAMVFANEAIDTLYNRGNVVRGHLVDSIGIIRLRGGNHVPYTMVGPRYYTSRKRNIKGSHAHFLESGTAPRQRFIGNKKMGLQNTRVKKRLLKTASTGEVRAQPFMKPAYDSKKEVAATYLKKEITHLVQLAIEKAGFEFKKS